MRVRASRSLRLDHGALSELPSRAGRLPVRFATRRTRTRIKSGPHCQVSESSGRVRARCPWCMLRLRPATRDRDRLRPSTGHPALREVICAPQPRAATGHSKGEPLDAPFSLPETSNNAPRHRRFPTTASTALTFDHGTRGFGPLCHWEVGPIGLHRTN